MKKLVVAVVVIIGGYAAFANVDGRGVKVVCTTAWADESGTQFTYAVPGGGEETWTMPEGMKIVGLHPGERIGFSYAAGRLTGMLYGETFYLASPEQRGRVYQFEIVRAGRGTGARAWPQRRELPARCPP